MWGTLAVHWLLTNWVSLTHFMQYPSRISNMGSHSSVLMPSIHIPHSKWTISLISTNVYNYGSHSLVLMPSEHIPYGKWAISLISVTYNNYRISLIVLMPSIHIPHGKWAISLISLIYNFRISLFVLMPSVHVFTETELKSSLVWTLNPLNFDVGYSGRG